MKKIKNAVLHTARAVGLFTLARLATRRGVRILCYHGVWRGDAAFPGDAMFIGRTTFRRRLDTIARHGYPVVTLDEAVEALAGRAKVPDNAVVITIDDGWFSTFADMLPALQARRWPATLYCDSGSLRQPGPVPHVMARWLHRAAGAPVLAPAAAKAFAAATDVARPVEERRDAAEDFATVAGLPLAPALAERAFDYMTPAEMAAAVAAGLDVQLHTHRHTLGDHSVETVRREIADNRYALAALLPLRPSRLRHFCYPSGETSPQAAATLAQLGLASATTTEQGIAYCGMDMMLLPRLLDGEQLSDIEFEAELSGFADMTRSLRRWFRRIRRG